MEDMVSVLTDMGFSSPRSQTSLAVTSYLGVEPAMEWLLAHAEELDDREFGQVMPVAASLLQDGSSEECCVRCTICNVILKPRDLDKHMENTDHDSFVHATLPVVNMVSVLTGMGFSSQRSQTALAVTSYLGVEPAVKWLLAHAEELDDRETSQVMPVAASLLQDSSSEECCVRCTICSVTLKPRDLDKHMEKTGHDSFIDATARKMAVPPVANEKPKKITNSVHLTKKKNRFYKNNVQNPPHSTNHSSSQHGKVLFSNMGNYKSDGPVSTINKSHKSASYVNSTSQSNRRAVTELVESSTRDQLNSIKNTVFQKANIQQDCLTASDSTCTTSNTTSSIKKLENDLLTVSTYFGDLNLEQSQVQAAQTENTECLDISTIPSGSMPHANEVSQGYDFGIPDSSEKQSAVDNLKVSNDDSDPEEGLCESVKIQIRFPDGGTASKVFRKSDSLKAVRDFAIKTSPTIPANFGFLMNFPRTIFTLEQNSCRLDELGLWPTACLFIHDMERELSSGNCNDLNPVDKERDLKLKKDREKYVAECKQKLEEEKIEKQKILDAIQDDQFYRQLRNQK